VKDRKKAPFEMFKKKKPDLSMMHVFGCRAFVQEPKELRKTLDGICFKGIFVGYATGSKAWQVLVQGGVRGC
jgi:hypothetical protein